MFSKTLTDSDKHEHLHQTNVYEHQQSTATALNHVFDEINRSECMRCSRSILITVSKPWMKQTKTAVIDDNDEKGPKRTIKVTGSVCEVMKSCPLINQTPRAREKATMVTACL